MFARLESDMNDAIESLKAASEGLDAVKDMDISKLPVRAAQQPQLIPPHRRRYLLALGVSTRRPNVTWLFAALITGHRRVGCEAGRAARSV